MTTVHTCPVCLGRGKVQPGFYPDEPIDTETMEWPECRACGGRGVLWDYCSYYPPYWYPGYWQPSNPYRITWSGSTETYQEQ